MTTSRFMLAALCVVFMIGATGCGRDVNVVVPEGFSGEVRVTFDPVEGVPLETEGFGYVLRIPADGHLRINDHTPLFRYHRETVRYTDGTLAPVARKLAIGGSKGLTSSTRFPGTTYVWVIESTSVR